VGKDRIEGAETDGRRCGQTASTQTGQSRSNFRNTVEIRNGQRISALEYIQRDRAAQNLPRVQVAHAEVPAVDRMPPSHSHVFSDRGRRARRGAVPQSFTLTQPPLSWAAGDACAALAVSDPEKTNP
jgi:hypothetical protein